MAANIRACFTIGNIFGTLFGGWLGDTAGKHFPDHGRPWVAVVSVGIGVPLTWVLLYGLPQVRARTYVCTHGSPENCIVVPRASPPVTFLNAHYNQARRMEYPQIALFGQSHSSPQTYHIRIVIRYFEVRYMVYYEFT